MLELEITKIGHFGLMLRIPRKLTVKGNCNYSDSAHIFKISALCLISVQ